MHLLVNPANPSARARLAEIWLSRAVSEHEATDRFAIYAKRLAKFGLPQEFVDRTAAASADERRHVAICLEVAQRFGAEAPKLEPYDFWREPDGPEVILANIVATCCINETLNIPFLVLSIDVAEDEAMKTAMRELLKDEVNHGKLGWAYLAWARGAGQGLQLATQVPTMLMDGSGPNFFAAAKDPDNQAELAPYGELTMAQRQKIFFDTVEGVIFPGLEANGVSAELGRAWVKKPTWRDHPA